MIIDFENFKNEAMNVFSHESNRENQIFFLDDIETAKARLFAAN